MDEQQEQQRQHALPCWRTAPPDLLGIWESRFRRGALSLMSGSVYVSIDANGHLVYRGLGMSAGLLTDLPVEGREWRSPP